MLAKTTEPPRLNSAGEGGIHLGQRTPGPPVDADLEDDVQKSDGPGNLE